MKKEMIRNKLVFKTKDENNNVIELAVKRPDADTAKKLQKVYNTTFKEALDSGAILKAKVESVARSQNVWDDEKEQSFQKLQKELFALELKLAKGGIKKSEAKSLAMRMRDIRLEMRSLTSDRNSIEQNTAESQAENARFNYSIAYCTFYNDGPQEGKLYFKDYDDFLAKVDKDAAIDAAKYIGLLTFNLDPNFESNLPENKFLKQFGYINDECKLVDKQGRLVDAKGRLVRHDGRFINENNELVDGDGVPVDEEGNYKVEFTPFIDDDEEAETRKKVVGGKKKDDAPLPA